jgi:hypothetical protein
MFAAMDERGVPGRLRGLAARSALGLIQHTLLS